MKSQKTIHVFVGIVVNEQGEILMTKRNEKELPEVDNHWELPGGKVNFGETAEQAIEREIFEETGYQVEAQGLLPITVMNLWEYPQILQHTIVLCFVCSLKGSISAPVSDHRVSEVRWVKPNDVDCLPLLPGVKPFLNSYFSELQ